MGKDTKINWTHHTANFWWGCMKVSDGCKNCYAETLSRRYGKQIWGPPETTEREPKIGVWEDILKWDKEAKEAGERRRVFVSSMSDFLEDHPTVTQLRNNAMRLIERLEWLDVLILTKRPENAPRFLVDWFEDWPAHVWMGASVENQKAADERIPELSKIPAPIRFLSVEPMLEPLNIYGYLLDGWHKFSPKIKWVIVGGESGPKCRPFGWDWARDLEHQCACADVAFWMKQGGGYPNKRENLEDIPEDLRIRELPEG